MSLVLLLLLACERPMPPLDESEVDDTATVEVPSDESNRDGACILNRECPADQRCECIDEVCLCRDGTRGTGVNGVDTCTVDNDCASALCVEGPGGVFYCSDECSDETDCEGALPVCADVAFVGRICIRES